MKNNNPLCFGTR